MSELIGHLHGNPVYKGKKTDMHQNSLEAFGAINEDGTTITRKERVLMLIQRYRGITRQEISKKLSITINATCGRVNFLIKEGDIYEAGNKIGTSGKKQSLLKAI